MIWRTHAAKTVCLLGCIALLAIPAVLMFGSPVAAAPALQISPTPIPILLPTLTPVPPEEMTATPTRTPTPVGPALVEALQSGTNVRAGPDINAERLGGIEPGQFYAVLGRGEGTRWIKIQYPDSPDGTAWVYEEVVRLTGDVDNIPYIDVFTEPTIDANPVIATQTIEAMMRTPGALQTATALAFAAGTVAGAALPPAGTPTILPTFTYPPDVALLIQTTPVAEMADSDPLQGSGLPPIIPVIVLASVGSLGLLVGVLRRDR